MVPTLKNFSDTVRRLPPFIAFAVVGGAGFVVNEVSLFVGLHVLGMSTFWAAFLGFLVTVTFTWLGNRIVTFHENAAVGMRSMMAEWVRFVGVNSAGLAANYGTFATLVRFGPSPISSPYIALGIGSLVGLVFNFYFSRRGVFRG